MRRENKWVWWEWNSLSIITNSIWVIELNVYETIEWETMHWEWDVIPSCFISFHVMCQLCIESGMLFHLCLISFYVMWQSWKQRHETFRLKWPASSTGNEKSSATITTETIKKKSVRLQRCGYREREFCWNACETGWDFLVSALLTPPPVQ